ncbi:MAG: hypothetical protein FWH17_07750 [Oscillospiraceae bacterium]|nr:hypothetical protein [Oscillospiraceae bacterium]
MSGMFDSKTDKSKRKQERAQKEERAKKKVRSISIWITSVFLLLFLTALIANSGWLQRTLPVVSIDGVDFSAAEYEYFFNSQLIEYVNFYSQIGYPTPDLNRPFSSQVVDVFVDEETGEMRDITWDDIFTETTYTSMRRITGLYNEAKENDFALTDEDYAALDAEFEAIREEAKNENISADAFLQFYLGFGDNINMRVYKNILEFVALAELYSEYTRSNFEYTDAQIDEYYEENADSIDLFSYRTFTVAYQTPDDDVEDMEAAIEQAKSDAHDEALGLEETISNEDDFISAAQSYDEERFAEPDSTLVEDWRGSSLSADFAEWLTAPERRAGDTTVIEVSSGSAILLFVSRDNGDYREYVDNILRSDSHSAWVRDITDATGMPIRHFAFFLVNKR